ncbi:MAG: 2-C-methyl-D-erythritol 4-phosphate cytidylyltransferase [candidate division WS2 bacterium]|uniref:2-C-methyl-D-erythritol 4-phosphate cytidylyltransferase n=1 Tax=Psychracetigena formicireducens TaxID=2986056 RepID=A0A9E2BFZ1_PSYF1|nr:2-C-methyl-D-erythritol 4-phosphate cytidylyltransferase [Candidatus Psychracetigena formicireducens]MBT9144886.1 2-C-methyl-D-erythritol 4-phosphate cytidylyltransferase [Candidatus Psychracetigena formicireducens]MBT9149868.1 2-C-methyl-D-erythritol 4-phosphate cytidylyltransferase [Candidatus Psychracetigena formicireducens]
MKTGVIIPAAGFGLRYLSPEKKLLSLIKDEPLILYTLRNFLKYPGLNPIVVVVPDGEMELFSKVLPINYCEKDLRIKEGGRTRAISVHNGFQSISKEVEMVLIHDGARPAVSYDLIQNILATTEEKGCAVPVLKVFDNVAAIDSEGRVSYTLNREYIRLVQTPQGFKKDLLLSAYQKVKNWEVFSDEGSLVYAAGYSVYPVAGDSENIKVTIKEDIVFTEYLMGRNKK